MTSININLGDAFLIETPPNDKHLYIAIAPTPNNKYLFVNLTTRRARSEIACILTPSMAGVPSFITSESVIAYQFAREMSLAPYLLGTFVREVVPHIVNFQLIFCPKYNKGD